MLIGLFCVLPYFRAKLDAISFVFIFAYLVACHYLLQEQEQLVLFSDARGA